MQPARSIHSFLEGTFGAAGMVAAFLTPFLRAHRQHWGSSPELAARTLPGDTWAGPDAAQWTHAVEIDAPAADVWPWVVQVGADRAGFYSYEFLENLAGCAIRNADRVVPEWQLLAIGDGLVLHPSMPPFRVIELQAGHHFVATAPAPPDAENPPRGSWLFMVEPVDALRCRFISRFRLSSAEDAGAALSWGLLEPVGYVMDRRMLLGVRERAERRDPAPSLSDVGPLALEGRTCLVTGATRGIGRATAVWLARAGAHVGLLCRNIPRAEQLAADLRTAHGTRAFVVPVDLSDMDSVVQAARHIQDTCDRADVLIHNAGEYRLDLARTPQGWERMTTVGYLGPWLLTHHLGSLLHRSPHARLVITAGTYHRYGSTDLSDVHFDHVGWKPAVANNRMQLMRAAWAMDLAHRWESSSVTVNAVHPGAVRTDAQDAITGWQRTLMQAVAPLVMVSPERGALPNLRLAGEASLIGVTGRYFHGLHEAQPSPHALDPQFQQQLWDWTTNTLARWM